MEPIWVADSEPNERFPLYTRGNVGEVFPHVMSALTGTLIGDTVQRAQADLFVEMGALRPHEITGPSVGTGVFGGYLYGSASVMRLFGARMPGMTPEAGDAQVYGDVDDMPPYTRRKGDRNLVASLRLGRFAAGLLRRPDLSPLDEARDAATVWLATMPDPATAADGELIAWVGRYPHRLGVSMQRLLRFSSMAAAPRELLDRALDRPGIEPGLANRIVGGTGDVDSAELARRLWALGRVVAGDESLTAAFDAGLEGIGARVADSALAPMIATFLVDHGHRGNDEYELAVPSWGMDPTPVYAAIDRLRHAPADRDPVRTTDRLRRDADAALAEALATLPRHRRPLVRRTATVSRLGSIGRERAKDILVLENQGARRALHELVRRASERGGPSDARLAFCVTWDELPRFMADPSEFDDVIAERATLQRDLDARVPPPWFVGHIPDPSTWPLRDDARPAAPATGSTVGGIAVSGGSASGPARVITDPGDPRGLDPGDVLVCAITDPSWTPLFLGAAAVVCDTGALQSHAAIVARELGIPAVMSVAAITSVADGTMLHVDGDRGEVRVG